MRTIPNKISQMDREPSFDTRPVLIKIAIGDEITSPGSHRMSEPRIFQRGT